MKRSSNKTHWDDFWSASRDLGDVYGTDDRILENLGKYVDLAGLRVLEVGAGTGRDTDKIASQQAFACALDYSEQSLTLMSDNLKHSVYIVCGDAFNLPFTDESFDVVFHQGLMEHFRNPGEMLDENVRVLKKGGLLLVDVPQRYHYYTLLKHILILFGKWFAGWETEFSVSQLRRLIEERGLRVAGIYGHNPSPPIWYRGLRRVLLRLGVRLSMYPVTPRVVRTVLRSARGLVPPRLILNTAMVIGCVARKN
ncbi:MAG: class I SAM-dependent methyltransferase [Candidatus Krumholzibacteria bacterium]|nr:class I SAM-dependent methyltransferase [Candidatus Krumholzibacteria bacterium]